MSDRSEPSPVRGTDQETEAVVRAREMVRDAEEIVILTGAGVSAESGVPTFRDPDGLWMSYRPEELATPEAFGRDPRLVWEWYQWRRDLVAQCSPNDGHDAIASLQVARAGVALVTQNVDGLHRLALASLPDAPGTRSDTLLELHGSLFGVRCTTCSWRRERREPVETASEDTLPRCPDCGALVRPDVVWFGEALDPDTIRRAFELARRADLCLVVGTSAVVQPAASIPLHTLDGGGAVVEVNPEPTALSAAASVRIREAAGTILPRILTPGPR